MDVHDQLIPANGGRPRPSHRRTGSGPRPGIANPDQTLNSGGHDLVDEIEGLGTGQDHSLPGPSRPSPASSVARHRFGVCHKTPALVALAALAICVGTSCVAKTGWERSERRACDANGPARVCLMAEPDRPISLVVGGTRVIPGECVEPPVVPDKRQRGGRMPMTIEDGRSHTSQRRKVRVRPGREVVVTQGKRRIQVVERSICSGLPDT